MKKYNLFLDDVRIPQDVLEYSNNNAYRIESWVVVRSYDEFVDYILKNGMPNLVSFDHDLADQYHRPSMYDSDGQYVKFHLMDEYREKTGYDCAKWLVERCMDNEVKLPKYLVHSMNPVGNKNIQSILDNYSKFEQ